MLTCEIRKLQSKKFISHLPQQSCSRESSILEHTKHISNLGSWGTDLELLAAATYFQIPVYYCCVDIKTNQWLWNCIQPIASPTDLRYPIVVVSYPERAVAPTHFEIVYWRDTRYDSMHRLIVKRLEGCPSTLPPAISTTHEYTDCVLYM